MPVLLFSMRPVRAGVTLGTVATELRRGLTLPGRVAAHLSDGMSVEVESGETGFVPALFIRDSGANDPPPVGTVLTVVLLGRDTTERLILSARLRDLSGASFKPVAAQDSCDWCYAAATPSSLALSERLGLVAENAYACGACLAVEAFRQRPPDGWEEDTVWPFLLPRQQR